MVRAIGGKAPYPRAMRRPSRSLSARFLSLALPLLLLLLLLAPSVRAAGSAAAEHFRRGMAAYALEDWDAAIAEFDKGFREQPRPEFLYNIAQAHRQARRFEPAIRFYQRYLELKPQAADRPEVERQIRALKQAVAEQHRAAAPPPLPPEGAIVPPPPPEPPTPAPAPPAARSTPEKARPDGLGIGLSTGGAVLAAVGVALVIVGVTGDARASDRTSALDLGGREGLHQQAGAESVAGTCLIGAGAAVLVGGVVKLLLRPRGRVTVGLGASRSAAAASLGWEF
jgi:tetratricopeptide (TPR) repeat protein